MTVALVRVRPAVRVPNRERCHAVLCRKDDLPCRNFKRGKASVKGNTVVSTPRATGFHGKPGMPGVRGGEYVRRTGVTPGACAPDHPTWGPETPTRASRPPLASQRPVSLLQVPGDRPCVEQGLRQRTP